MNDDRELNEILRQHDADTRDMLLEQMPDASDEQLNELIQHSTDPVVVETAKQLLTDRVVDQVHTSYPYHSDATDDGVDSSWFQTELTGPLGEYGDANTDY